MELRTNTRVLNVRAFTGMCNRLTALVTGLALAEASGRSFTMFWQPYDPCMCRFDQLFQNDWDVRADPDHSKIVWTDLAKTAEADFPDLLASPQPVLSVIRNGQLIQPKTYPHHRSLDRRAQQLLNELEPIPEIAARIENFRAAYFRPKMIGVHLRRGDFILYRPDMAANLDAALGAVDKWLNAAPDAGILLCTDDGALVPRDHSTTGYEGVRETFQERYGSRVVWTTPRSLDRRTPEAIQDGLVDFMLLRQTDFFVGSQASSFSGLAVYGRSIPKVIVTGMTEQSRRTLHLLYKTRLIYLLFPLIRREFGGLVHPSLLFARYKQRWRLVQRRLRFK
ncbi:MAG TPA: hypothetical protein VFD70_25695 [Anaerolineae bacterium]|nr:hypothetical protein [Anaerolineae bacterium]